MKRIILSLVITLIFVNGYTQNKLDLMPSNMINYIGKVTQPEFEKLVGEPVGYEPMDNESEFVVYEVEPTYGQNVAPIIALRCYFRESDGKLINIQFPSPYPLAYWINFGQLSGYNEKLHSKIKKYPNNKFSEAILKLNGFGCQILNVNYYTDRPADALINYHIIK